MQQCRVVGTRHRSLRASLDWSYALLAPGEQAALRRLAMLGGSFTLEAARQLASDLTPAEIADEVAALTAKSLLTVHIDKPAHGFGCLTLRAPTRLRSSWKAVRSCDVTPPNKICRSGTKGSLIMFRRRLLPGAKASNHRMKVGNTSLDYD